MDHKWGRSASAGTWLSTRPAWALSALLLGLMSCIGIGEYQYTRWTALERFYLPSYLRSTMLTQLGVTRAGRYTLLTVVDGQRRRLAVDADLEPALPASGETNGPPFTVRREAGAAGVRLLALRTERYDHQAVQAFLRTWIYGDRRVRDLVWPPLAGGLVVLTLGLLVAMPQDAARAGAAPRSARRELVSPRHLRDPCRTASAGQVSRSWRGGLGTPWVRVPRGVESSHFLIMGDTGTGKSALIRQLLLQIEARGETAIVYDPALEYTPQFYDPRRGDQILNPLDARTPFWTPADELRLDAEALTLAESLFPDRPNESSFFADAPRRIMAFLLTQRPDAAQIVDWLCDPKALDRLLEGTPYAVMIDPAAGPQRAGVLASLNMVADACNCSESVSTNNVECHSSRRPAEDGLFTSTPERAHPVPLTSLWLDLLVLRLMNQQHEQPVPGQS